jgi:hypothetical protein
VNAELAQLLGGVLRRPVVPQIADRYAAGSVPREAKRDRLADPARPSGDED